MKKLLLLALLGYGVVFAQSAGVGNRQFLSPVGQAIASMDPFVTLAEFYDSVSPFPPIAMQLQLSNIYTVFTLPACNSTAKGTESAVSQAVNPVFRNSSAWVSY